MAISRGSMSQQITKAPGKRKWSAKRKRKSIVPDLVDFLKKHIVPLKKGEVVRGEPQKGCLRCKKRQWMCTCWKLMKGKYYA